MNLAIAQLEITRDNALHNAPIHEAEGNTEQATLDRQVADDCRVAIADLKFQID